MKKKFLCYTMILVIMVLSLNCSNKQTNEQTIENLKESVIRENMASAIYKAYIIQAQKEYLFQVAKLFNALSVAENIHLNIFLKLLKSHNQEISTTKPDIKIDSTKFNLQNSIKREILEIDSIYPKYIKEATESKLNDEIKSFNYAWQAEKTHKNFLVTIYDLFVTKVPQNVKNPKTSLPSEEHLAQLDAFFIPREYYICPVDGKLFDNINVPSICDLCQTPKEKFIYIK